MNLKLIEIKSSNKKLFPFNTEIFNSSQKIELDSPITTIVGENGTRKSTLLELLALKTQLPTVGAGESNQDSSLNQLKDATPLLTLNWKVKSMKGFFLRSEDFFGYQKRMQELINELREQKDEFSNKFNGYGKKLSTESTEAQIRQITNRYGDNTNAFSHGESFLNLFSERLKPKGLYILDEPEVPLSPKRQLSLISLIKKVAQEGSQFIIATHSPILMALENSTIYEISKGKFTRKEYKDLEHVQFTKDFLNNPGLYLRPL